MIDLKLKDEVMEELEKKAEEQQINPMLNPDAYYLREISRTLKDILKEMRKRKV